MADSSRFNDLVNILKNNGLYNQIWSSEMNKLNGQSSLALNLNGKYFRFLKSVGETYPYIKDYVRDIEFAMGIDAIAVARIMKDSYSKADFNKPEIRLIWAVHYITVSSASQSISTSGKE